MRGMCDGDRIGDSSENRNSESSSRVKHRENGAVNTISCHSGEGHRPEPKKLKNLPSKPQRTLKYLLEKLMLRVEYVELPSRR
jgi:hypothetical protein